MSVARSAAYKKKTLLEHVLLRAETYVGSKEPETMTLYIPEINESNKKTTMVSKDVTFVPAFFKIFDEIVVNAADNKVRDASTDTIKVTIDPEVGEISVYNNGKGIPVVIHEEEKIYVPEMIFGHLLTGSNYDDEEKRVTGGRNGYGAKLTNIYSTEFTLETHDSLEGKTYKQKWTDNMTKVGKAKITANGKKSDYTKVTFKPDLGKLNMTLIDEDTMCVLKKRVYDLTGSLSGVKVYLNGEKIKINNFKDYISTYLVNESEEKPKIVYERLNPRWEIAVALSDTGGFQQVSFVNSIATTKGGTHVTYITDQIVAYIKGLVEKKDSHVSVKPAQVKNQLFVFVNCLIENPSFEGQVKETMTLRPNKYGSTCVLTDAFLKKVSKLGIVESTLELIHEKDVSKLKKTDGQKRNRLNGVLKLEDANNAGTKQSKNCTLFLVEGDSASQFALTGIPVVKNGQNNFGVFPLRGKLLNVREASTKQKLENSEIAQLKQILGLQEGKVYTTTDSLRYGHICSLTDADLDGIHIKGLILNWLESSFPSLLKIPGFLLDFKSPIVKCSKKGNADNLFYNLQDYEQWKKEHGDGKGWEITYFKGLASSEEKDVKRYFRNLEHHLKTFAPLTDLDSEKIDMAFSKKRAADRKVWLQKYSKGLQLDDTGRDIKMTDFIDNAFIEFSMYDNIRSIPSMVDGLKPGQRKILYTAFKTNLTSKLKVAQFSGRVSELTEYRHGEQSLNMTIVNMAQWFVGSNNVALLYPSGGFGSRRQGGTDAGSPRYIFTYLQKSTRILFPQHDDPVLDYIVEDGVQIEPHYYVPVIPTILVNGADGIGSGYSTSVLCYDPKDLIDAMTKFTEGSTGAIELKPWYRGYTGDIFQTEPGKWTFTGKVDKINDTTLEITELPIHTWTQKYKEFLEKMIETGCIKDYEAYHTNTTIRYVVRATTDQMNKLCSGDGTEQENLLKTLKLVTTKHSTNMMLFDSEERLKKYDSVQEILEEFYRIRISVYKKRKASLLKKLEHDLVILRNKTNFIAGLLSRTIDINNRKKDDIVTTLVEMGFHQENSSYSYLLNMPFYTLTEEKIIQLRDEMNGLEAEIAILSRTTVEEMYRKDLSTTMEALVKYEEEWITAQSNDDDEDAVAKAGKRKGKSVPNEKSKRVKK